uniref:TFIIS-type domain-containing protein n=1 Tax=viral metagenome TaxID=1070528 RepID=A0A6C0JR92_9ZZZZ
MKKSLINKLKKLKDTIRIDENVDVPKCRDCGGTLIIQPRQTRCADEGMTVFYLCKKCPKTFKI